jgi:hypothetical protein
MYLPNLLRSRCIPRLLQMMDFMRSTTGELVAVEASKASTAVAAAEVSVAIVATGPFAVAVASAAIEEGGKVGTADEAVGGSEARVPHVVRAGLCDPGLRFTAL